MRELELVGSVRRRLSLAAAAGVSVTALCCAAPSTERDVLAAPGGTGPTAAGDMGVVGDNGDGGDVPTPSSSRPMSTPQRPIDDPFEGCGASADLELERVTPIVTFVVDGSGSMDDPYPGSDSRWIALRDTLLGTDGLIAELQGVVRFGLILYTGPLAGSCPFSVGVGPRLSNLDLIEANYPATALRGTTPTALVLEGVSKDAEALPPGERHVVVLATDGSPNTCVGETAIPVADFERTVSAAESLAATGTTMYVVSLVGDGALEAGFGEHLETLARIGGSGRGPLSPASKDQLLAELRGVVGGETSCIVALNGRVTLGRECEGQVVLNDQLLLCDESDGWQLADESHIELLGSACESYRQKAAAVLHADFPCELILAI